MQHLLDQAKKLIEEGCAQEAWSADGTDRLTPWTELVVIKALPFGRPTARIV